MDPALGSIERRFARAAFWSILGGGLSRGGSLVATLVVARILGPADFGKLSLVTSAAILIGSFSGLGLGLAITRRVAQHRVRSPDRAGAAIRAATRGTLLGGCASGLLLFLLATPLAARVLSAPDMAWPLRTVALWIPLAALATTQGGVLAGLEAYRTLALWSGARGAAGALLFVLGAWYGGIEGAVVGLGLAELLGTWSGSLLLRRERARCGIGDAGAWGPEAAELIRFGVTTLVGSAAVVPALWLPRLWLARSGGGYAELGIFDAAAKWSLAVTLLPAYLGTGMLPVLANVLKGGVERDYRRLRMLTVGVVTASAVLPAAIISLVPGWIMAFGGPGYRSGASVLVVMAGASVAVSLNNAFGSLLLSRGVVRVRMAGEWLLAIVMVGASLVLIPLHGAMGLAVAHVLAYSASSVLAGLAEYWQSRPAAPTNALHGLHGRRDLR